MPHANEAPLALASLLATLRHLASTNRSGISSGLYCQGGFLILQSLGIEDPRWGDLPGIWAIPSAPGPVPSAEGLIGPPAIPHSPVSAGSLILKDNNLHEGQEIL